MYQFHLPSSVIADGTSTTRTFAASIRTATASPRPIILNPDESEGGEDRGTMTAAALV